MNSRRLNLASRIATPGQLLALEALVNLIFQDYEKRVSMHIYEL